MKSKRYSALLALSNVRPYRCVIALCLSTMSAVSPGQVANFGSARASYGQAKVGNEQRFTILPSMQFNYDTNAVPYTSKELGGQRGNFRITPGIDLTLLRYFGATQISVSGSGGYDFNSRYKFFNQPRININSLVKTPVGGKCEVIGAASFSQFQLNQSDLTQTSNARLRSQNYDISSRCDRAVGLSPVLGMNYSRQTTSDVALFNFEDIAYRGGISYYRPALGRVTINAHIEHLTRPEVRDITGQSDNTNVRQLDLSFERAISPRLQARLGGGYYQAKPSRAGVQTTSGFSYDTSIFWSPKPRLSFSGSASKRITNESGINATYATIEDYELTSSWQISRPSSVQLTAGRTYRKFAGEDLLNITTPIRNDKIDQVSAKYSIDTLTRLRLSIGVSHLWRSGGASIYNYQSSIISGSVGARF